jgi:hypothetical protein
LADILNGTTAIASFRAGVLKQALQKRIETIGMGVAGYDFQRAGEAKSHRPAPRAAPGRVPPEAVAWIGWIQNLKSRASPASTGKSCRILSQKAWIV